MARSDPQVNIRMPQELKDRLELATATTNRSLNGEILERLEQSFDGPVKQSEVELLLQKLSERDDMTEQVAARDRLLAVTGIYLRLMTDRVATSSDRASTQMVELVGSYADCLAQSDFDGALKVVLEMVRAGTAAGILDEEGQLKPEFAHLKPTLPRGRKSKK